MPIRRDTVVSTTLPEADVLRLLNALPQTCTSSGLPVVQQLLVRVGLTALGRIHKAFIVKARGGTDESGLRWKPLSPKTIAYSRRHPGLPKDRSDPNRRPSYALTAAQRRRWWQLYGRSVARYARKGRGESEAKSHAARLAWNVLKAEGATTLLARYGNTPVEILMSTGVLLNSLAAAPPDGAGPAPPKVPLQVFTVARGNVTVGTTRPWAWTHHEGTVRIPRRRLWPAPEDWPASWRLELSQQLREGVLDVILYQLARGNP